MYDPSHRYQQSGCPRRPSSLSSCSLSPGTTIKVPSHRHVTHEPTCMSCCSPANNYSPQYVVSSSSISDTRNHRSKKSKDEHSNQITCPPPVLRHRITGMEGKKWTNLSSWTGGRVDVIDFGGKKKDKNNASRKKSSYSFVQASFCTSSSCQIYCEAPGGGRGEVGRCYTLMDYCATSTSGTGTAADSDDGGKYSYCYTYNHNDMSSTQQDRRTRAAPSRERDKRRGGGKTSGSHTGSGNSDDEDGDGEMDQLAWAIRESKLCSPRRTGGEPSHLSTITGSSYSFIPPSSTLSSSSPPPPPSNHKSSSVRSEFSSAEARPPLTRRKRRSSSPAVSITPSSSASRAPSFPLRRRQSRATAPSEHVEKWPSLENSKFPSDGQDAGTADDDLPPRYSDLSFRSGTVTAITPETLPQDSPRTSSARGGRHGVTKDRESSTSLCSCSRGERECSGFAKRIAERSRSSHCSGTCRAQSSTSTSRYQASRSKQYDVTRLSDKDWV